MLQGSVAMNFWRHLNQTHAPLCRFLWKPSSFFFFLFHKISVVKRHWSEAGKKRRKKSTPKFLSNNSSKSKNIKPSIVKDPQILKSIKRYAVEIADEGRHKEFYALSNGAKCVIALQSSFCTFCRQSFRSRSRSSDEILKIHKILQEAISFFPCIYGQISR